MDDIWCEIIDSPLMTQALNLFIEYLGTDGIDALGQSIAFSREALASTVSSARVYCLYHLARCLSLRFDHIHEIDDVSEAIRYLEEADAIPQEPSEHAVILQVLARTLGDRYQASGDEHDFDRAIQVGNRGLDLGISDTSRVMCLYTLSQTYGFRFSKTKVLSDLSLAIQLGEQALEYSTKGHPKRSMVLGSLARLFTARFHRLREFKDIDNAVAYASEALEINEDPELDEVFCMHMSDALGLSLIHI